PLPSITQASAGTCTVAPTAVITPWLTSTVPPSIAGPDTGTIRAFVIANDPPAESARGVEATKTKSALATKRRSLTTLLSWNWNAYRAGYDAVTANVTLTPAAGTGDRNCRRRCARRRSRRRRGSR